MGEVAMANILSGKFYRVFIASPSDLFDERKTTRQVIDRVNHILAGSRLGWRVELLAWEDTLPGYARPQEIINQELDTCNLFVGLLWKRWGQSTGKFSSGFEEEFNRARDRRSAGSGEPEIWLFFKNIEEDFLSDPGEQLQRTLSFRQQIQESREVFYKEFVNNDEWERMFQDLLLQHILKNAVDFFTQIQILDSQPPTSMKLSDATRLSETGETYEFPHELDQAIKKMSDAIKYNNLMEKTDISRLHLAVFSWMSQTTTEVLSNHDINQIYLFREGYKLLSRERMLVFRTIISDKYDYVPGWYWLIEQDVFDYKNVLAFQAMFDNNSDVRVRSLEFLSDNKIIQPSANLSRDDFLSEIVTIDASKEIVSAALGYLDSIGTAEDVQLLEQFVANPENENYKKAMVVYIDLLAPQDIDKAFRFVLEKTQAQEYELIMLIDEKMDKINFTLLVEGVHHHNKYIRLFSARELYSRHMLSFDEAEVLKTDSWAPIREVAFKTIIRLGKVVEVKELKESFKDISSTTDRILYPTLVSKTNPDVDLEDIIFELFCTYSKEDLLKRSNNIFSNGNIAYQALMHKYYDELSDKIVDDINTDFKAVLDNSIKLFSEQLGDQANEVVDNLQGQLGEFVISTYIAKALSEIERHEDVRVLEAARRHLDSRFNGAKYYALKMLQKIGNEQDVKKIIEVARTSYGVVKDLAFEVALLLSENSVELIKENLLSKDSVAIKASFDAVMNQENIQIEDTLKSLLYDDNNSARLIAVYYFVNKLSRKDLEVLLQNYFREGMYYYDVICWLDRIIYAPKELAQNYIRKLRNQLR